MSRSTTALVETLDISQIAEVNQSLRDGLRESCFSKEALQYVLDNQGTLLASELLEVVRGRVRAAGELIVRTVPTDHRTLLQIVRPHFVAHVVHRLVAKKMPRSGGDPAEVVFFQLRPEAFGGRELIDARGVMLEYAWHGLGPADPRALGAVNVADLSFVNQHTNLTLWPDGNAWRLVSFAYRWDGHSGRKYVVIDRPTSFTCSRGLWFAGHRLQQVGP